MSQPPPIDYRQHLELETPEHVMLDYEIAGVGSRAAAALADWLIIAGLAMLCVIGAGVTGIARGLSGGWVTALLTVMLYCLIAGYFALFEGLRNGQTPGKRWLGIRTIRDTGHGVTFGDALARNLLLPVDAIGMIGALLIAFHPRGRRLGDLVAGTVVVRDRPVQAHTPVPSDHTIETTESELGAPMLGDEEFQLLRGFVARAPSLPAAVRDRFATQLVARFDARFPLRAAGDLEFLTRLHEAEVARRSGRFGSRAGSGARSVAERLIARKNARWNEFHSLSERVTAAGLDALTAAELPDFAARYREIAADLARARTYRADPLVLAQLERLVAAGHGALYRSERQTWRRIWMFLSRECPAGVVQSWRYVALAYVVFLLPAAAGFAMMRAHPERAAELIPDVMLERAEAGASHGGKGTGYVLAAGSERPLIATSIITNNVKVAFNCFAGGVVLGVGSLVMLAYNGLSLGSIAGHFANVGALPYLMTFVLGHSVLEISAICFAGAAGFLLGLAIIAPGELKRGDALALAGRRAMRLVGSTVIMLVVAGTIEGFVSTSELGVTGRAIISGTSAVILAVYLAVGARAARRGA